nr:uncharacterized protein LOC109163497 [Ipomoea batatas]
MDRCMGTAATISAELVAACTWTIWTIWNDVVWNAKSSNVEAMKTMTIFFVDSWQQVFSITPSLPPVVGVSASVWSPPPQGILTCNVDVAILTDTVGFGAVFRDHGSWFIAAYSVVSSALLESVIVAESRSSVDVAGGGGDVSMPVVRGLWVIQ